MFTEMKASQLDVESDFDLELDKGKKIIDAKPSVTITTTKVQLEEPDEPGEEKHLFHSHMWVKGIPLDFIIDNDSQENLISAEAIKRLNLTTTYHPQSYTIGWLNQG
jgi:hypothetical protein